MTEPHLVVVDPSIRVAEEEGVATVRRDWRGRATVVRPALDESDRARLPEALGEADAVVLMGSAASVHDDLPWIPPLAAFVRAVLDGRRRVPLLAICFGHQLVARVAGARIGFVRDDREHLRGVVATELVESRLLPGVPSLVVAASHREHVLDVPAGFRATGSRPGVPVDVLEHDARPIVGVQFHPEAGPEFLRRRGIDPGAVDPRFRADGPRLIAAFHHLRP